MEKNMLLIIGILVLIGCKEQIEKATKFIFDASKMSNQTNYFYSYNSDRLSNQTEKTFTIMFGQVVDSMITKINFEYNNKGLLVKKISQTDFEEKPTIKIYDYDKNDSLISEISISPENDTTFWEIYKYYPDGKKTIFHRSLRLHFDPNEDFINTMENKKLDTLFYKNEFEYIGNLCKTQKQYDTKGKLIKTIKFDYNRIQLIKETHLTFINDMEKTEKIKIYDYSKSDTKPDYCSLNSQNDTVELRINEFLNGQLITTAEIYEYGKKVYKTFYEKEKEVGMVGVDISMNFKIVESYEYYKNGNLKSFKSYNEEINYDPSGPIRPSQTLRLVMVEAESSARCGHFISTMIVN